MNTWSIAWGPDRQQQERKVATCPKAKPRSSGLNVERPCGQIEVRRALAPPRPSAWSKLRRRYKTFDFSVPSSLLQTERRQTNTTYGSLEYPSRGCFRAERRED